MLRVHWRDWCWSWNSNTLATWCGELTHVKRPWCWERLRSGGEGDDRGWNGWMASPTQWTWIWVDSGSWWWTGRPSMLQSPGLAKSRRRLSDWTEYVLKVLIDIAKLPIIERFYWCTQLISVQRSCFPTTLPVQCVGKRLDCCQYSKGTPPCHCRFHWSLFFWVDWALLSLFLFVHTFCSHVRKPLLLSYCLSVRLLDFVYSGICHAKNFLGLYSWMY